MSGFWQNLLEPSCLIRLVIVISKVFNTYGNIWSIQICKIWSTFPFFSVQLFLGYNESPMILFEEKAWNNEFSIYGQPCLKHRVRLQVKRSWQIWLIKLKSLFRTGFLVGQKPEGVRVLDNHNSPYATSGETFTKVIYYIGKYLLVSTWQDGTSGINGLKSLLIGLL